MKIIATKRLFFLPFFLHFIFPWLAAGQSISGIINSYYKITAINFVTNSLTLNNVTGLTPGTKVMMIQMKGASINSADAATFGDISAINDAGNYEFNFVCGISGNDVLLQLDIVKSYNVSSSVQLVAIPQYSTVTVTDTLRTIPWDPVTGTGGVVILDATDTIFLNSGIEVYGKGFTGGSAINYPTPTYDCIWTTDINNFALQFPPSPDLYYTGARKGEGIADYIINKEYGKGKQANGGGGGNNHNTGGAGGSNYGTGGSGGRRSNESPFNCHGPSPGIGGLSLSGNGYSIVKNRIFFGGGGGGGHQNNNRGMPGGNGGGIVFISANVIVSSGMSILANGITPINIFCANKLVAEGDGGGGGGGGGTIILNVNQVNGSIMASANGAAGNNSSHNVNDCTGPGGGGGGGVVWAKGAIFPPSVTASVNGGINGVVAMTSLLVACRGLANGATPGTNGAQLAGFISPSISSPLCYPLPLKELQYFRGKLKEKGATLWWMMNDIKNISAYFLESSLDKVHYKIIGKFAASEQTLFSFTDNANNEGTIYYRLRISMTNGAMNYSEEVTLNRPAKSIWQWLSLQPNPAGYEIKASVFAKKQLFIQAFILDCYGKKVNQQKFKLNPGISNLVLSTTGLPSGIYLMMLEGEGLRSTKTFIKKPG